MYKPSLMGLYELYLLLTKNVNLLTIRKVRILYIFRLLSLYEFNIKEISCQKSALFILNFSKDIHYFLIINNYFHLIFNNYLAFYEIPIRKAFFD